MARGATRASLACLKRGITIAGGGLAGLSLAAGLRLRGVDVTVLEAGAYPRHRVCGEFISGVGRRTLEVLGIEGEFEGAKRHRSLGWHEKGVLFHQDELQEAAYGISRHELDQRLRRRVEELGGRVETGTRVRPERREGWVWAAGRRPCAGRWIGLKGHVRGLRTATDLEMHGGANGYIGVAGVEDGWVNVCGLFRLDRSLRVQGRSLLLSYLRAGGNHGLAERLGACEWREGSFCAVAGFSLGRQPVIPGLLTVGDAESMIPPFTGNGMSMAFEAAECALEPLAQWAEGRMAWEDASNRIRFSLRKRFRRRLAAAGVLHEVILAESGRMLMGQLAKMHFLPFRPMLSLVR